MLFELIWLRFVLYALAFGAFGFTFFSTLSKDGLRKTLGLAGVICGFVAIPFIWVQNFAVVWCIILTLVLLPVLIDAGRMYAARFNDRGKAHSTLLDVVLLAMIYAICLFMAPLVSNLIIDLVIAFIGLAIAIYSIVQTLFAFINYRFPSTAENDKLPSITLAIPARNENQSLSDCLMAAANSDYKKLEIVVLDDCSQDHTSHIIRSFAQSGVKFIQGDLPSSGWLGKNYAMRELAKQSNGDYIVFMNVDTRLEPQSLTKLMTTMTARKLDMISILPRRNYAWHFSGIMETLRYYWQVILPPTSFRTPVASSLWVIRREKLDELGGFVGQKHKIIPENFFARQMIADKKYRFYLSTHELGVRDAKKWLSSLRTSVRLLYPALHRHPIEILGNLFLHLTMLAPYILLIISIANQSFGVLFYVSLVASLFLSAANAAYSAMVRSSWPLAFVTFPLQIIQEIIFCFASPIAYEFGDVDWKGRNVCYPVMEPNKKRD